MAEQLALDLGIRKPGNTVLDIEHRLITIGWIRHHSVGLDRDVADAHRGPMMPAAYDWACSGITKGTLVPTWRCCVCGGLAIRPWHLDRDHNCGGPYDLDDCHLHGMMAAHRPGPPWHSPAIEVIAGA